MDMVFAVANAVVAGSYHSDAVFATTNAVVVRMSHADSRLAITAFVIVAIPSHMGRLPVRTATIVIVRTTAFDAVRSENSRFEHRVFRRGQKLGCFDHESLS